MEDINAINNGINDLLSAIIEQAIKDYERAYKRLKYGMFSTRITPTQAAARMWEIRTNLNRQINQDILEHLGLPTDIDYFLTQIEKKIDEQYKNKKADGATTAEKH